MVGSCVGIHHSQSVELCAIDLVFREEGKTRTWVAHGWVIIDGAHFDHYIYCTCLWCDQALVTSNDSQIVTGGVLMVQRCSKIDAPRNVVDRELVVRRIDVIRECPILSEVHIAGIDCCKEGSHNSILRDWLWSIVHHRPKLWSIVIHIKDKHFKCSISIKRIDPLVPSN